jgi:hypothetical protein
MTVNKKFMLGIAYFIISQIWIVAGFTSTKEGVAFPCYLVGGFFVIMAMLWGSSGRK